MTTLAVDLDGVLVWWDYGFISYYNRLHGTHILPTDEHKWDFSDLLPHKEFQEAIDSFHEWPLFWQSLPAYAGNCDSLTEFIGNRPEVNIVYLTARPSPSKGPSALVQTNRWLRAQNLMTDSCALVVVPEWRYKAAVGARIEVNSAIDDHPETVAVMRSHGIDAKLLSRPWNRDADLPRVADLKTWLNSIK